MHRKIILRYFKMGVQVISPATFPNIDSTVLR
nr:MAG TPA: hypothetical protein [Caudoviricetes sp.]